MSNKSKDGTIKLMDTIKRIGKRNHRIGIKILNNFRKMYNDFCRKCQIKMYETAFKNKMEPIDPKNLCDKCRGKTEKILQDTNKLIEKGYK